MRKGEPMNDLISRQEAIDAIEQLDILEDMCVFEILSHIELAIGTLPSAEPEQKTGKWQKYEGRFDYNWECSECGCSAWEKTDYCAHCGARMECEEE